MRSSTDYPGTNRIINSRTKTRFQERRKAECCFLAVFFDATKKRAYWTIKWHLYYIRYP